MSEWITDRLPTEEDAVNWANMVWVTWEDGTVGTRHWSSVAKGQPWKLLTVPDPYVEPKRWTLRKSQFAGADYWYVLRDDQLIHSLAEGLLDEAAQRICDIYNEEMP
jgi:hypothetical protein